MNFIKSIINIHNLKYVCTSTIVKVLTENAGRTNNQRLQQIIIKFLNIFFNSISIERNLFIMWAV